MIDGEALVLTARLAFVTCLILITLSIPLAAWLARQG